MAARIVKLKLSFYRNPPLYICKWDNRNIPAYYVTALSITGVP